MPFTPLALSKRPLLGCLLMTVTAKIAFAWVGLADNFPLASSRRRDYQTPAMTET